MAETLSALEIELSPKGFEQVQVAMSNVIKQTEEGEKKSRGWGIAHLAAIAGIIKSSPIAQSYMQELSAITGVFADTILTQLMPVLDPMFELLWSGTEMFEQMDGPIKTVIAGVIGLAVAMYVLSAHPIIGAITLVTLGLILLEKKFGAVTEVVKIAAWYFDFYFGLIKKISHALTGGSLVPDLELLGNIIKTLVAPQLLMMKLGMEGVTRAVEVGGAIVNKTFTMINNFTFGSITGAIGAVQEGIEAVGSAANKVKGWLSF